MHAVQGQLEIIQRPGWMRRRDTVREPELRRRVSGYVNRDKRTVWIDERWRGDGVTRRERIVAWCFNWRRVFRDGEDVELGDEGEGDATVGWHFVFVIGMV